jgi:outer membrane protein assembly complex protein YaeT
MNKPRAAQCWAIAATALCLAAAFALPARAQTAVPADANPAPQSARPTVTLIRIVGQGGAVLEENPAGLSVRSGQPFDAAQVRASLKQLFRSGRFADVQAETAEVPGGLRLDFVVAENYFINRVRVLGLKEPPSEAVALSVMRLHLGEVFTEAKLQEAMGRLGQLLEEEGFYQAIAASEVTRRPETRQLDITVTADPGERARIGEIHVQNHTPFRDARLINRASLKPRKQVTSVRRTRDAERLRNYLVGEGYLGSRVTVRRGEYDRNTNLLSLELEAFTGPRIRVEVSGARVSAGDLRELLPIYQEGTVDDDLLREGQRNLRAHFEREGYFDTRVTYTTTQQEDTEIIRYQIERGERRRLVGIEILGNQYFSDSTLTARLRVAPATFLSPGRFNTRLVEEDVESLRELYRANGFPSAEVARELLQDYRGKRGDLFLRFSITEGPQALVGSLAIEGNAALADDFLLDNLTYGPGQPYSEFNAGGDRNNILALYFDNGYPEARVEVAVAPAEQPGLVNLTYRVTEGPQVRVGRVLLDGYENTRRERIAREVQVQPEGPLRQGDVIETQRKLYELGIFNRVQVAPQNPDGSEPSKTMVVLVDEAKRYTLSYGLGLEFQRIESETNPGDNEVRAAPRGLFEISKNNVLGRAHTLGFRARASTLQGRALLTYSAPAFLGRPALTYLATGLYDRTRDVSTFTADRYEAGMQVAWQASPWTTMLFRYSFRRVVVDPDSLQIDPQEIPLFSQPTRISGPGVTWIRDRREPPADARAGSFNSLDVSLASKPLGSSASFARLFLQNSSFHPIGRSLVFARSARFGVQEPFSDTIANEIPLPERFFAGGGYSLRGFGLNQSGPRDPVTGFPVGGLALLVLNHELRFPLRLPFVGDKLGGALFYDAGNVYSRLEDITFRTAPTAADISSGRLNYFSHSLGFGVRYPTPVGPVRLDLGYLLNPSRFAIDDGMGGTTLKRLPRFQFFLSIGPNF